MKVTLAILGTSLLTICYSCNNDRNPAGQSRPSEEMNDPEMHDHPADGDTSNLEFQE